VLLARRSDPIEPDALAAPIAGAVLATGMLMGPTFAGALDGSVVLAAVILLVGVTAVARRRELITADRAVGLGSALAGALADPQFRVAIRAPDGAGWLDTAGNDVEQPEMLETSTRIERDGQLIAVITHDPATLADPQVEEAVMTAIELAAHNVRLRADLAGQLRELEASRRRLVDAGLREREALGTQVEGDVLERMTALQDELGSALVADPDGAAGIARAAAGLDAARTEIQDLARGLYPASLAAAGLAEALADLARRSPMEVTLDVASDATGGSAVDATVYFVCAEALANAARHAQASLVRVTVRATGGALTAIVTDDGIGGADPSLGSGLRGLRDRVDAMGGTLEVRSVAGEGTRLEASIPG
jgi:signal transduction histidine kinase